MRVYYSSAIVHVSRSIWCIRVTNAGEKTDLIDIILETHNNFETWNELVSTGVTSEINSLLNLNISQPMSETAYMHLCTLVSIIGIKDIRVTPELKGRTHRIIGRL